MGLTIQNIELYFVWISKLIFRMFWDQNFALGPAPENCVVRLRVNNSKDDFSQLGLKLPFDLAEVIQSGYLFFVCKRILLDDF